MLFRMCLRCRASKALLRSAAVTERTNALWHSRSASLSGRPSWSEQRHLGNTVLSTGRCTLHSARSTSRAVCVSSSLSTQKELRLQHILVPKSARDLLDSIEAELKGKLNVRSKLRQRAKHSRSSKDDRKWLFFTGGAQFGELARKHSKCPSAGSGGELGWVSESMGLHPALQEAIFALNVGEHTTVETAEELHLFKAVEERDAPSVQVMMVDELEALLKEGPEAAQFIDVREQQEHDIASLRHFQLRPLSRLQEWLPSVREELDPSKTTVCLCHAGVRSMQVANILLDQGFTSVHNVSGGIEAYSCFVDPSVPRY